MKKGKDAKNPLQVGNGRGKDTCSTGLWANSRHPEPTGAKGAIYALWSNTIDYHNKTLGNF